MAEDLFALSCASAEADRQALVIHAPALGPPQIAAWGRRALVASQAPAAPAPQPSSPDIPVGASLFPTTGNGFSGTGALMAARDGAAFAPLFRREGVTAAGDSLRLDYRCASSKVDLSLQYRLIAGGVLESAARITNCADAPLRLGRIAALALPLPAWAQDIHGFHGAWAAEGGRHRMQLPAGAYERRRHGGRLGHDWGGFLIIGETGLCERRGRAIGLHFGGCGNFHLLAERLDDGSLIAQAGELLDPGEVTLQRGETHATPPAYAALSEAGLGEMSLRFHRAARALAGAPRPRPVHLNSWEAAYFDISADKAAALGEAAADMGVERFVLDDGWFRGRTSAQSGLGDWSADPVRFPGGLGPLIERLGTLGMQFGLWVEPEMASPDSDLLRANPDWALCIPDAPRPTGRSQLVLDLTRAEVRDHVVAEIDAALSVGTIDYVKWDCNRDLYPAANAQGPCGVAQTAGFLDILARLSRAHPEKMFESCASGGGRMSFGLLPYMQRFWPSDMTDAAERVRIQRSASLFFPPEMLGAHVGASPNHLTQRRYSMAFRCLVAMFGHFGVELDPRSLDDQERAVLRNAIAEFKSLRPLIISGRHYRLDSDPGQDQQAILGEDGANAMLRLLQLNNRPSVLGQTLDLPTEFKGPWRMEEIWLEAGARGDVGVFTDDELRRDAAALMPHHPLSGRLFAMERV